MPSWEQSVSTVLHLFRLDRIKSKVLVFLLVATLIPALTMGWQSYLLNQRFVTEKISEELRNATFHTVREVTLWLKERLYEMRVFSSSYEVTENLEAVFRTPGAAARTAVAQRRLTEYLRSVREKFADYEELMVLDPGGAVLFTSAETASVPKLPAGWLNQAQAEGAIVGEAYWDPTRQRRLLVTAVPIKTANGRFLGLLAAKLNLTTVETILKHVALDRPGEAYLVGPDGTLLATARGASAAAAQLALPPDTARALFGGEDALLPYDNAFGTPVIGGLKPITQLGWGAVAEIPRAVAYAQVARVRNLMVLMVGSLILGIGLTAYLLGLTIVPPLDRLSTAATRVAAGDLDVTLPIVGHGELGHMTQVFNDMVMRLRQGREELGAANLALSEKNQELQKLSVTDGLTGLYNRRHLIEALTSEAARARRLRHTFSLVMIDIDHFKHYNDTYGHVAGDRLLSRIATVFKDSIRNIDYAARYGGEEFMLVLHEVGPEGAMQAAERLRARVASERFGDAQVQITVSIGVAAFPEHGDAPEALITAADAALYEAKKGGRNRVARAPADPRPA